MSAGIFERRRKMQEDFKASVTQCEWRGEITMEEVKKHNSVQDLWAVFNGYVYDLTQYALKHPGGTSCLTNPVKDLTKGFFAVHPHADQTLIEKLKIGHLAA